jgi:predicted Fe-Mo cluster-binding NifX family protein
MRICIPTVDGRGLESEPHGHFGSAPFFTLVDTESGATEILRNDNSHHDHGTCHPLGQLGGRTIDGVVCQGMGRRAVASLEAAGIGVFLTSARSVQEVIREAGEGTLRRLLPGEACGGHGHGGPNGPCR